MCWFPRNATPVRGTSTHSLDVVNTPKTPGEGDHVDKKARPTQRSDTMPAARKTGMPIKMEVASASAVEKSAPVPKPSAPAKAPARCPHSHLLQSPHQHSPYQRSPYQRSPYQRSPYQRSPYQHLQHFQRELPQSNVNCTHKMMHPSRKLHLPK